MPSPIAHSLMGIVMHQLFESGGGYSWKKILFFILAANFADLDFIPGLFFGDVYRFHHGFSHSIAGSIMMSLFLIFIYRLVCKDFSWRLSLLVMGVVLSHSIIDIFVADPSSPYGCPLFWPLSDERMISPFVFFGRTSLRVSLFNHENLKSFWIEMAVFLPWVAVFLFARLRRSWAMISAGLLSLLTMLYYGYVVEIRDGLIHFKTLW